MARELQPCGTYAAYRRHLRHRETPCTDCCAAYAKWRREHRPEREYTRGPYGVQGCGTNAGYHQHRRRGEQPCRPCTDAMTAYQRQRVERIAATAA